MISTKAKNTKDQILSAYYEALEKLNEKQSFSPKNTNEKTVKIVLLKKLVVTHKNRLQVGLAKVKIELNKQMDFMGLQRTRKHCPHSLWLMKNKKLNLN